MFRKILFTCAMTMIAWMLCETAGGLLFLYFGVRLWEYHILPVFWSITSYFAWALIFVVGGLLCFGYLETEREYRFPNRWYFRSLFLIAAGPFLEVVFNGLICKIYGTPLYTYTLWSTFEGSGSLLSPIYYLTLLSGFWFEETCKKISFCKYWLNGPQPRYSKCRDWERIYKCSKYIQPH